jgi:hypothetical protein
MKQAEKNKKFLGILAALLAVSAGLALLPSSGGGLSRNASRFQVADTASVIRIAMRSAGTDRILERQDHGWRINGKHDADPDMVRVLLSVIRHVSVSRKTGAAEAPEILNHFGQHSTTVTLTTKGNKQRIFEITGNANRTTTWIKDENSQEVFEAELPGYESYVAGIFEVTGADWRDRLLFSSTWRSLRSLEIQYPPEPAHNLRIEFDGSFFVIPGVTALDSAALLQYLDHYAFFQVDRFLDDSSGIPVGDLTDGEPHVRITVEDIREKFSGKLELFGPVAAENAIAGRFNERDIVLINRRRADALIARKGDFQLRTTQ